jgi:predicted transglutaminase-like cysteine proteinase
MQLSSRRILLAGVAAALSILPSAPSYVVADEQPRFIAIGGNTRPPFGWIQFCQDYAPKWECDASPTVARDVVLSSSAWRDLIHINRWVNDSVLPITDEEHWGMVEHWSYPDDGYGDCDNYVLLKRKMLIEAGWPREALLITVVRDRNGDGHAVLTVKSSKGEFILDNQTQDILLWFETGYQFVKRQSQTDPNTWVSLGDPRSTAVTALSGYGR